MFVYDHSGMAYDWECRHGYPSQACGVVVDSPINNLCAQVGEHMFEWYNRLPEQSHVRLGKVFYMERGELPVEEPNRPNLGRLAGL